MFNKALLAKQVWRIMKNPESLTAKIMKAKYFPHSSIMEASMGNRPSQAWRSLLVAKDLVHSGAIWRVGDGHSIRVWRINGYPHLPLFQSNLLGVIRWRTEKYAT
jgi:hypothetical protein